MENALCSRAGQPAAEEVKGEEHQVHEKDSSPLETRERRLDCVHESSGSPLEVPEDGDCCVHE